MTILLDNSDFIHPHNSTLRSDLQEEEGGTSTPISSAMMPDYLVACFAMGHVLVWATVGVFDR